MNRCAEESTDGFMPDLAFAKYGYFRYHFNQYSMRGLWHVSIYIRHVSRVPKTVRQYFVLLGVLPLPESERKEFFLISESFHCQFRPDYHYKFLCCSYRANIHPNQT